MAAIFKYGRHFEFGANLKVVPKMNNPIVIPNISLVIPQDHKSVEKILTGKNGSFFSDSPHLMGLNELLTWTVNLSLPPGF